MTPNPGVLPLVRHGSIQEALETHEGAVPEDHWGVFNLPGWLLRVCFFIHPSNSRTAAVCLCVAFPFVLVSS